MRNKISTPCVGVCSTIYGDDICRGCHRTFEEIIKWNNLSDNEKLEINQRLDNLQNRFTKKYLEIKDLDLLEKTLVNLKAIRFSYKSDDNQDNKLNLVYKLIKKNIHKINASRLPELGVSIKEKYSNLSLNEILTKIDEAIYNHSESTFYKVS
tara:strand:- start:5396 stop:5854 length:459 start_codon:yes stop_codon:yes gene_type:complete